MHSTLKDWEARRSGAGMSIVGKDATTGIQVKLTDIGAIEVVRGQVVATGRTGLVHQLLTQ